MSKGFCRIDHSIIESLRTLSDAECGRLMRSLLVYSATGETEELCGNERFVWPTVKAMVDDDKAKRAKRAEANRQNGKKGGRPPADEHQKNPLGFLETQWVSKESTPPSEREEREEKERKKQRKNKEEIEEKELPTPKENVIGDSGRIAATAPPKNPSGMSKKMQADFDAFWSAYPRKVGKGAARKSFVKAMGKGVTLQTLLEAIEQQKRCKQWNKDGAEYIPHPSTWLNQERWEDVIEDEQPVSSTYRGNQITVTRDWGIVYDN